jgi:hypothetical protein
MGEDEDWLKQVFDPYQLALFSLFDNGETDETVYSKFLLTKGERLEEPFNLTNSDMEHYWFHLTTGYKLGCIRIYSYIQFDTLSLCMFFANPKPLINVIGRHPFFITGHDNSKNFGDQLTHPIFLHDGPDDDDFPYIGD